MTKTAPHDVTPNRATPNRATAINPASGKAASEQHLAPRDDRPDNPGSSKTVCICDTEPVMAEGIRALLGACPDLKFLEGLASLSRALDLIHTSPPDVLMLDKAFGIQAILEWFSAFKAARVHASHPRPTVVVWGVAVTEAEALRFLQAGARGILRKTAAIPSVIACLRSVAAGRSWMEDSVFRDPARPDRYPHGDLTARERQVLELVEQGFKNKEIAQDLGIRPGTVKIHLKHIFEKTGVRGRYGLALNVWRDRGPESNPDLSNLDESIRDNVPMPV